MDATNKQGVVVVGPRGWWGGIVELPGDMVNPDLWKLALRYQFLYSVFGLISGLACILLGLALIANGFVADGHWTAELFGIRLSDASPGIVLFVIGLLLPWLTSFSVRTVPTRPTPPQPPTPPTKS